MLRLQWCSATVSEVSEKSILEKHTSCTSNFICSERLTVNFIMLNSEQLYSPLTLKTAAFISDLETGFCPQKMIRSCHRHVCLQLVCLYLQHPWWPNAVIFPKTKDSNFDHEPTTSLPFCWKTRQPLKFMLCTLHIVPFNSVKSRLPQPRKAS